jgi:uncharacterized protein involved in outer membrane biogenesis
MSSFFAAHPKTRRFGLGLAAVLAVIVLFLALFNWNYFRPALARAISAKTGRPVSIQGDLKVHLFSFEPSAEVNGLTIENPAWAAHPVMLHADRVTVAVSLGRLLRGQLVLPRLEVIRPALDLERDAQGRASWEMGNTEGKPQADTRPAKIPTIRRLLIEDGTLQVSDRIRKLVFTGSLNAADESVKPGAAGARGGAGFRLRCGGTLNAKPFHAQLTGGPLINLEPDRPYDLEAHLAAADITLDSRVSFPKPFDLAAYQVKFTVSGNDLANLYYLTGLALPNTPPYRLGADVTHTGTVFRLEHLKGRLGSSDLEGEVQVETAGSRPKFSATLHSDSLNLVDVAPSLGQPAAPAAVPTPATTTTTAATAPSPAGPSSAAPPASAPPASGAAPQRLFPDADLQVNRVRGMNADVTYDAESVIAPKMPMKAVKFHLRLVDGLLEIDPLTFVLDAGRFSGRVSIDARQDVPLSSIAMRIEDVDLGQFKGAKAQPPPLKGDLVGRLDVHGSGSSVHKLASTADGTLSVALPSGQMNDAIAELTGIDVMKGLGLLLSRKQPDTQIRCGVIDFQAHDGTLQSKSVFIDTTNVLITGRGSVNLGDERLDLALQGDPKKVRLFRLRSPIVLRGTLLHPTVGLKADQLLAQAGVAAALGTLLTPVAAALALIDPGLAKNKDCTAALAQFEAGSGT